MKKIDYANIALLLVIISLSISYFLVSNDDDVYNSPPEYVCKFHYEKQIKNIPEERCCYQIQNKIKCEKEDNVEEYKCYNRKDSVTYYTINTNMLRKCEKEGYDVNTPK